MTSTAIASLHRGKYRIHTVAEMTGVPAATLRAWERRYGVPVPARTSSAYRVYSDADIALIRRVVELCEGGLAPSEAARVALEEHVPQAHTPVEPGDPYAPLRESILQAIEAFDPRRLERELDRAAASGPPATVAEDVLRRVLLEVGERWHTGRVTVAQEHLASEAIGTVLRRMLTQVQPEGDARMVLLAGFADEEHEFPLQVLAVHLASWGLRVVQLGVRTPPAALRQAVAELQPALVGLSCTIAPAAHRARELVDAYADAIGDVPWIVGGAATSTLARFVSGRGGQIVEDPQPRALRSQVERMCSRRKPRR